MTRYRDGTSRCRQRVFNDACSSYIPAYVVLLGKLCKYVRVIRVSYVGCWIYDYTKSDLVASDFLSFLSSFSYVSRFRFFTYFPTLRTTDGLERNHARGNKCDELKTISALVISLRGFLRLRVHGSVIKVNVVSSSNDRSQFRSIGRTFSSSCREGG